MPSEDKTGASRSTIEEAADLVATSVQEGFDDVLRAARAYARDHQGAAARQMNDYAEAAGAAAKVLETRENTVGARLLGEASSQMSDASTKIASASAETLADGLEDTARRNPALFAAGAVVAGVALGYLIKSATSRREANRAARTTTAAAPARLPAGGGAPGKGPSS